MFSISFSNQSVKTFKCWFLWYLPGMYLHAVSPYSMPWSLHSCSLATKPSTYTLMQWSRGTSRWSYLRVSALCTCARSFSLFHLLQTCIEKSVSARDYSINIHFERKSDPVRVEVRLILCTHCLYKLKWGMLSSKNRLFIGNFSNPYSEDQNLTADSLNHETKQNFSPH